MEWLTQVPIILFIVKRGLFHVNHPFMSVPNFICYSLHKIELVVLLHYLASDYAVFCSNFNNIDA